MFKKVFFSLFVAVSLASCHASNFSALDTQKLSKELSSIEAPGMSLVMIKQGQTYVCDGFGLKRRDRSDKVNEKTLFQIASLSKAFTSEVVSLLVKEGTLEYDKPIIKYLPELELFDKEAQSQLTLRDLLSHQSGLPSLSKQSMRYWFLRDFAEKELFEHLKYIPPELPIRTKLRYNNLNYLLVDMVVRKQTNKLVSKHIEEKILKPLKMDRTTLSTAKMIQDKNRASPHFAKSILKKPAVYYQTDQIAASFGVISCAEDMQKWLRYLMEKDFSKEEMFQEHLLFSKDAFRLDAEERTKELLFRGDEVPTYGLGWMVVHERGRKVYLHTGTINGFSSYLALDPKTQSALFCSINELSDAPITMFNHLLDSLLDLPSKNWKELLKGLDEKRKKALLEKRNNRIDEILASKVQKLPSCEGTYSHRGYGDVKISKEKGTLVIELPSKEIGKLKQIKGGVFEIQGIYSYEAAQLWVAKITQEDQKKILTIENYAIFVCDQS